MGLFWTSFNAGSLVTSVRMQDTYVTFVDESQNIGLFVEYLPLENETKFKAN
jgi:hypothetical protein